VIYWNWAPFSDVTGRIVSVLSFVRHKLSLVDAAQDAFLSVALGKICVLEHPPVLFAITTYDARDERRSSMSPPYSDDPCFHRLAAGVGIALVRLLQRIRWAGLAMGTVLFLGQSGLRARESLTVFAAASLQDALTEVVSRYRQEAGQVVRLSFGASGALARQIEQGAPADVFISADEAWMDHLQSLQLIIPATRRALVGNRLVLVVPTGKPVRAELKPGFDLKVVIGLEKWVTGDPASVPAGRYAKQALSRLGAWDWAATRLVAAENVRVALAFVERGEAAAGIVYRTDVVSSSKVRIAGLFPSDSHLPIIYPGAIVAGRDSPAVRSLLDFVSNRDARSPAREIFGRYGFEVLP
jgi:molybdate transport system substrate-binding protein